MENVMSNSSGAKADLATVEVALLMLDEAKPTAIRNTATFAEWRVKHDALDAERERLSELIVTLEHEECEAKAAAEAVALRERYDECRAANQKLAARIKSDLKKANAILVALLRDTAQADIATGAVNAQLPDGLEPLVPPEAIARTRAGLPRQDLTSKRTWLWTTEGGMLIGDQDSVRDYGGGRGRIGQGSYTTLCHLALYDEVEFHPEEPAQRPHSLWQMRLVGASGPHYEYDGTRCNHPHDVLAELARGEIAAEPHERPIEIELRPVPTVDEAKHESIKSPPAGTVIS
ncbi:hypothetical protein XH87_34350 [Bradyrhizobium sp. CCBAU 53415]|nr:hypothetical protein [Bradyrhizobium sp. CCBAU 53415]